MRKNLSKEQTNLAIAYHINKTSDIDPETEGRDYDPITPALIDAWQDFKAACKQGILQVGKWLSPQGEPEPASEKHSPLAHSVAWFTTSTWLERVHAQKRIVDFQVEENA
jgi:hypothetical protein